jgi:hypothetical protein
MNDITIDQLREIIKSEVEKALKKQKRSLNETNYLSVDEFIELHPAKISKQTAYDYVYKKRIPENLICRTKSTGRLLFYKDKVEEWIKNGMPLT